MELALIGNFHNQWPDEGFDLEPFGPKLNHGSIISPINRNFILVLSKAFISSFRLTMIMKCCVFDGSCLSHTNQIWLLLLLFYKKLTKNMWV